MMRTALRRAQGISVRSRELAINRLNEHCRQHIPHVYPNGARYHNILTSAPVNSAKPIELDDSIHQRIKYATNSSNIDLAYELLRTMIDCEHRSGSPKPTFADFSNVIRATKQMKGRKIADIAVYALEQLSRRIDQKLIPSHGVIELSKQVFDVLMTCTTPPKRIKLKHARDIFDVAQQSMTILEDLESRYNLRSGLDLYNQVLHCYAKTAIAASQAHGAGADHQETLHLAATAAHAAEHLITKMLDSSNKIPQLNSQSWKELLLAWCNVPSLDAADKMMWVLQRYEEFVPHSSANIYSMIFRALAQTAHMIDYDPKNDAVPAKKATALLHRLVTAPMNDGPRPLNAHCFASISHAFAKSKATQDFGEEAPAFLAESCLRQHAKLHEIGWVTEGPNDYCYGNVIAAWCRHIDVNVGALNSERLLHQLEAHVTQQPTLEENARQRLTTWYTMVLYALSRSTLTDATERAEVIFSRMESSALINEFSCDALIATWAKSPHVTEDRGERALRCMSRLPNPPLLCYNSCLTACAANGPTFADNGLLTADKIFSTIKFPSAATYGRMFLVYSNLLADQRVKDARLMHMFLLCCDAGLVTVESLTILEAGMSEHAFEKLLRDNRVERIQGKTQFSKLPMEWTRRVKRPKPPEPHAFSESHEESTNKWPVPTDLV